MPVASTVVFLLALGLAAGVASGLLGVGGGIVMVPALTLGLAMEPLEAKALSLLAIVGTGTMGVVTHRGFGNVELGTGVVLGLSGVAGAGVGYLASLRTPDAVFMTLFGGLLALTAVRVWVGDPTPRGDAADDLPLWVPVVVGLGAGVVSTFFGVGGGILFVPVMVLLGFPIHLAVGTSLLGVLVNGASGASIYLLGGHLDPVLGGALLAGAVVGARGGAVLADRLPADRLQQVFAAALLLVGVYMGARPWI